MILLSGDVKRRTTYYLIRFSTSEAENLSEDCQDNFQGGESRENASSLLSPGLHLCMGAHAFACERHPCEENHLLH